MVFRCMILCFCAMASSAISGFTNQPSKKIVSEVASLRGELVFEYPETCKFSAGEEKTWMNANIMCPESYAVQFISSKLKNDLEIKDFAESIRSGYDRSDFGKSSKPTEIKTSILGKENVGRLIITEFEDKSDETWKTEIFKISGNEYFYFIWVSGPKENSDIWLDAKKFLSSIEINKH